MIMFTVLMIILLFTILIAAICTICVGGATIFVFGDVIICILIIVWLIKKVFKRKK